MMNRVTALPPDSTHASSTKYYTVEDLVRAAFEKYEPIKISESTIRQSREMGKHLSEWYNPELGFSAGSKHAAAESGPQWGLTASQKLSFPGKEGILAEIALLEESRAMLSSSEMKLFIRYEVTRLAYEYACHLQRKHHLVERLKRLQVIYAYMAGRIVIPPEKQVEQAIVQTRIRMLEKEAHKIGADIAGTFARLNLYTALSDDQLPDIGVQWFTRLPGINKSDLCAKAETKSFIVRLQKESLEIAKKVRDFEAKTPYPDMGISMYYYQDTIGSGERSMGAGLSFPLPLFSQNTHAVKIAEEKIASEEYALKHAKRNAVEEMKSLIARYEYLSAMLNAFPISEIAMLEKRMGYADSEFKKGRIPLVMYLEMDASIHQAVEEIFNLQLDIVRTHTSIRFLAGDEAVVTGEIR
jgi:cobalt-zinc-cadmium efflux system outer membrane protein